MIISKKKTFKEKKEFYKKRQEFIDKFINLHKSDEPIIVEHEGKKYCGEKFGHLFDTTNDCYVAMWSNHNKYPMIAELHWHNKKQYSFVYIGYDSLHIIDGVTPVSHGYNNEKIDEMDKTMKKYNIYCFLKEVI